jgi:hypothetical protein
MSAQDQGIDYDEVIDRLCEEIRKVNEAIGRLQRTFEKATAAEEKDDRLKAELSEDPFRTTEVDAEAWESDEAEQDGSEPDL